MNEERNTPRRRPRKRRSKLQRFLHRYSPSLILVALAVCCVGMVIFTVQTISSLRPQETQPNLDSRPPETTVAPTEDVTAQINALIAQADKLAVTYDYTGAIELLKTFEGFEA